MRDKTSSEEKTWYKKEMVRINWERLHRLDVAGYWLDEDGVRLPTRRLTDKIDDSSTEEPTPKEKQLTLFE